MRIILAFLLGAALAVAMVTRSTAQAIPTSLPWPTTSPTTAPTTAPTSTMFQPTAPPPYPVPTVTATTVATTAPSVTTIPAYATMVPVSPVPVVPTILPGTPPPTAPVIAGCQVFPSGDPVYNRETIGPADPQSDAMMASFTAVATGNIQISGATGSWPVNYASAATPAYPLVMPNGSPVPGAIGDFPFDALSTWQSQGGTTASDHHLITLNLSSCVLYEAYASSAEPPSTWSVANGTLVQPSSYAMRWDLTKPYPATVANGVNAAKVPHLAGMVRWDDILAGCVCHALNIDVKAHSLRSSAHVFPSAASEVAGYYTGPAALASTALPLGARLRLRGTYSLTCPSTVADGCAQAQMVIKAWKYYGAYVMDTGGYSGTVYFAMQQRPDGTKYFPFNVADIATLNSVPLSAFEVVPPPGCASVSACLKP